MPRSLFDDPAFASIGRTRNTGPARRGHERAKLALAVTLLIAAGGFFAWHAGAGRGPTPVSLSEKDREAMVLAQKEAERIARDGSIPIGSD